MVQIDSFENFYSFNVVPCLTEKIINFVCWTNDFYVNTFKAFHR